jgi:hypothetical protein
MPEPGASLFRPWLPPVARIAGARVTQLARQTRKSGIAEPSRMPDDPPEGAHDADANHDLRTQISADDADEHAFRAWADSEITRGDLQHP